MKGQDLVNLLILINIMVKNGVFRAYIVLLHPAAVLLGSDQANSLIYRSILF